MAFLDKGAQVNTITQRYVNEYTLQVGPITDIMGSKVVCIGLGNTYTRPLGYVVIQVQLDGIQGYNEDQIALVIPDLSNFATRVPVILGMPTIDCVVNVMKEAEMDALSTPWANARAAHLLAVHRMMPMEVGDDWEERRKVWLKWRCFFDVYSESRNFRTFPLTYNTSKMGKAYLGEGINVMIQALQAKDGILPPGLTVQNTYTKLRKGNKKAVVVVCNNTAYLQTIRK